MTQLEKEAQNYDDLAEEAINANLYEIAQQRFEQTGLNVKFEAFLPKQCFHYGRRKIATRIVIEFDKAAQEEVVFEIHATICQQCEKEIQITHQRLFYSQEQINALRNAIKQKHLGIKAYNGGEM